MQPGAVTHDPLQDLRWRLQMSEQVRRTTNDRLSEVLKSMKWEEPISRPKGRAREDVLIAALEDVLRETRNTTEADKKASEQARIQMMEQLGRAEDEMLEKDHELLKVKEDREKHFRQILDQQERLAREILLRKEERISLSLKQQELSGLLKQREALVESLMKRQQELQMRLSRMGDMERELENTRSKLASVEEARDGVAKRCDSMGARIRGLESELETANEEVRRNAELAQTAEDKLASALAASPIASPAATDGWSALLNSATPGGATDDNDGRGAAGRGNGGIGQVPVGPHTPHRGVPHVPAGMLGNSTTPPESPSTEEVIEYAKFLGMNIEDDHDKELLWIAKEAMAAALPAGWTQHEDKDGFVFFYSAATEQSTYEHPMDDFYRKVYQRAKTTTERDPATLKMHTTANSSPGSAPSANGNGGGFFRRSPGSSGSSMPAGILKQPRAPSPSSGSPPLMHSNQYNAAERLRTLEAENALLRQQQTQTPAKAVTLQLDGAGGGGSTADGGGHHTPLLPRSQSMLGASAQTQTKQQESPPAGEGTAVEEAPLGGLTEEEIAKIPNPYGLSREALVKKFLFDQQRAHKNSTARARKSTAPFLPQSLDVVAAGAGGGLSVRVPALAGGGVSTPVPTSSGSNSNGGGNGLAGLGSSSGGRMPGQTSATPRPSDKAVEIMDQQGIMQIPQGAEIFEQRLRELSAEEAERSSRGLSAASGSAEGGGGSGGPTGGGGGGYAGPGMDYIDSWAEQNSAQDDDPIHSDGAGQT